MNDSRGLGPEDWHVPTDEEWKTLEKNLGMGQSEADDTGWRGTDEGGKLKETGTVHWSTPNAEATNSNGFTALPGGSRYYYGFFLSLGSDAHFWSSTEYNAYLAWYRHLSYNSSVISRKYSTYGNYGQDGFSVRLLRD